MFLNIDRVSETEKKMTESEEMEKGNKMRTERENERQREMEGLLRMRKEIETCNQVDHNRWKLEREMLEKVNKVRMEPEKERMRLIEELLRQIRETEASIEVQRNQQKQERELFEKQRESVVSDRKKMELKMAELKVQNILNLAEIEEVTVESTKLLAENERKREMLEKQRESLEAEKENLEVKMTNVTMQNILHLAKIGKLTVENTRLLAENGRQREVLDKHRESAAADRQALVDKMSKVNMSVAKLWRLRVENKKRLLAENERVAKERVRERNGWNLIRNGLKTDLAKADLERNQTLVSWKEDRGRWAKAKAGLQRIWDQQGERWMKEKEEIKRRSTLAAEEWMIELREKERAIEALEREKMRILCLHGQEKKGWEMEKRAMEKEKLEIAGEWERTNSEIEKMQREKDRCAIEKRDMVERMKEAYIKLYQMQTALRFGEQEQPQESKTAQRVRAKLEKKKRKEREMLEKNKVKELLRARKAESKEEVKKKKERVKAHLDEVARNYNEKKQGEKERENLLKKAHIPDLQLKKSECNTDGKVNTVGWPWSKFKFCGILHQ
ncbi:trichohyalin-like isoform X2 [Oncorhynchus keta]|uniref:trichohyalin-like isoform X2 n=1 Tax=Oncorhynchus keta TaxID=8018 RepID=UPI00227A4674|nr:trichohyalin-like isoform X2 [Oncorhynchus keta]